jgi:hypothetical protein
VAQTLQLEYACTKAESEEAQTLLLRKQLGRGSKWLTRLVLFVLALGVLLAFYFQLRQDFSPSRSRYILAAIIFLVSVFVLWKNRKRKKRTVTNEVEVSDAGVTLMAGAARVESPWAAFGDVLESTNLFVLVDRTRSSLLVLPKRAFPSENWQTWFRSLANNRPKPELQTVLPAPTPASQRDGITLSFRLGFRDYVARALASWFTWGMVLGFAGMILVISIQQGMKPDPRAVYSPAQVYFMFMLPVTLLMGVMVVFISAIHPWISHRKHLIPREIAVSEDSLVEASTDGTSVVPWTAFSRYKETRTCFLIWGRPGGAWLMFPKRAFCSANDLERCRALLHKKLHQSRWFIG